jgi:hypothetical protein
MRCLQIVLILPVDGFANDGLSIVSYRHFHETYLSLEELLKTCILSVVGVVVVF